MYCVLSYSGEVTNVRVKYLLESVGSGRPALTGTVVVDQRSNNLQVGLLHNVSRRSARKNLVATYSKLTVTGTNIRMPRIHVAVATAVKYATVLITEGG